MFDTLYVNHPTEGIIMVGTEARPANATIEKIVERFVLIRELLDEEIENGEQPPRRYYG